MIWYVCYILEIRCLINGMKSRGQGTCLGLNFHLKPLAGKNLSQTLY